MATEIVVPRVLFTGSRTLTWDHWPLIRDLLADTQHRLGDLIVPPRLVHGACPPRRGTPGGDVLAEHAALELGWSIERHPADWHGPCKPSRCPPGHRRAPSWGDRTTCPAAGIYRSEHMVALGAIECVAVCLGNSRGTTGCAKLAHTAGIPLVWRSAP